MDKRTLIKNLANDLAAKIGYPKLSIQAGIAGTIRAEDNQGNAFLGIGFVTEDVMLVSLEMARNALDYRRQVRVA